MKIKQAFTLIELLVVIAIIGILSGLIVVSMSGVTSKATIAKAQVFSNSLKNSLLGDLISEWKFDETSGTTAADLWGGNNGTLSGATTPQIQTTGCVFGNCLLFNGSTAYITVPNVSNLKSSIGTISMWFKWTTGTYNMLYTFSDKDVAAKWAGVGMGDWTGTFSDESLDFYYINGVSTIEFYYRGGHYLYRDSNWHNMVMTVGTNYNAAYIDGQKLSPLTYNSGSASTGNYFSNDASFDTLEFGSRLYNSVRDSYFGGYLDEIRIYDNAMPTSKIQEQYYAGLNSLLSKGEITLGEYTKRVNAIGYSK